MDRIGFVNNKTRSFFFNEIKGCSKKSWRQIAFEIGTARSMLDKYRKGELLLPQDRFEVLSNLLSETRKNYFLNLIIKRKHNWGQRLGGKEAYKINKKLFEEGRKKGGIGKVKYELDVNMVLSKELCEFIGAIIGDGFTNKYNNLYHTQIVGDRNLDFEYYQKILNSFCQDLFGIFPAIIKKENCAVLNIYSKRVYEMLTKRFFIPAGKKCYSVKIPEEILNSDKIYLNSLLRGMFNTDGGVGFDKRKTYKKPYIRVNYTSVSQELMAQLDKILLSYQIPHSIHRRKENQPAQTVQINGEKNVKKFLKEIGFSNPRHLNKIQYLL